MYQNSAGCPGAGAGLVTRPASQRREDGTRSRTFTHWILSEMTCHGWKVIRMRNRLVASAEALLQHITSLFTSEQNSYLRSWTLEEFSLWKVFLFVVYKPVPTCG